MKVMDPSKYNAMSKAGSLLKWQSIPEMNIGVILYSETSSESWILHSYEQSMSLAFHVFEL
jgi:hypothetical protein